MILRFSSGRASQSTYTESALSREITDAAEKDVSRAVKKFKQYVSGFEGWRKGV